MQSFIIHGALCLTGLLLMLFRNEDKCSYAAFSFSFQLILLINSSDTVAFIAKAVISRIDQVLMTCVLALILIYNYTILLTDHFDLHWDLDEFTDASLYVNIFSYDKNLGERTS